MTELRVGAATWPPRPRRCPMPPHGAASVWPVRPEQTPLTMPAPRMAKVASPPHSARTTRKPAFRVCSCKGVARLAGSLGLSLLLHFALLMSLASATFDSSGRPHGETTGAHPKALSVSLPTRNANPFVRQSDVARSLAAAATMAGSSGHSLAHSSAPDQDAAALGVQSGSLQDSPRWLSVPIRRYHLGSELTTRPHAQHDIQPQFPTGAEAGSAAGRIILRLFISEAGRVDDLLIERSDLPKAFEESARHAFADARFAPGEIDGAPVKSQMRVEVTFETGGLSTPPAE